MTYDQISFSQAQYLKSCLDEKEFPSIYCKRDTFCPEIAMIGRSNAGKSSLINHLTQKKDLVHVSSTPGKTQMINFFTIENKLVFVDLPGYGFAKIQKELKKTWAKRLSLYLENRPQLKLLILLLDLRRDLSEDDIQMIEWACFHKKKILFVFSKSDKLSKSEKLRAEQKLLTVLKSLTAEESPLYVSYSIKENQCRLHLKDLIITYLNTSRAENHGAS